MAKRSSQRAQIRRKRGHRERVRTCALPMQRRRCLSADMAQELSSDRGERDRAAGLALTIPIVAKESRR